MNSIRRLANARLRLPNLSAVSSRETCAVGKSGISTLRANPWQAKARHPRALAVPVPNHAAHSLPSSSRCYKTKRTRSSKPQAIPHKEPNPKLVTDTAILEFPQIYLVDSSTEKLMGPFASRSVLSSHVDLVEQTLVTVGLRGGGGVDENGSPKPVLPVCRIYNREALKQKEEELTAQARERLAAEKGRKLKIVEMSWSSDRKDSDVKIKRLREFLDKGQRVEMVLFPKKVKRGQKPPSTTMEEKIELVKKIEEAVATVKGAREARKRDGSVGQTMTFYFEGPSPLSKRKKLLENGDAEKADKQSEHSG